METVLALLVSAVQLLTIVSTNPKIDPQLKAQAIQIATYAISMAQTQQTETPTAPQSAPSINPQTSQPTQQFSGIIQNMDKSDIIVENLGKVALADPAHNLPFGTYFIKVTVLDESGNPAPKQTVIFAEGDTTETAETDTVTQNNGTDYHHTFSLEPKTAGSKTLTFTSNNKTKQITLTIE